METIVKALSKHYIFNPVSYEGRPLAISVNGTSFEFYIRRFKNRDPDTGKIVTANWFAILEKGERTEELYSTECIPDFLKRKGLLEELSPEDLKKLLKVYRN